MEKQRHCLYLLIIISVTLIVLSYISRLYDGTCVNIKDWSDFGGYFNNFLTPILTIFNIIILFELTIAVSNVDKSRTQAELTLQKNLLLLQYRKEAIERFYNEMSDFFDAEYAKDENKIEPHSVEFLKRFIDIDLPFFDFGENQKSIERNLQSLIVDLNLLHFRGRDTKEIDHERWMKVTNKKDEYLRLLRANAVGLTNADIEHLITENEVDNVK